MKKKWLPSTVIFIFMCYLLLPLLVTFVYSLSTEWYKSVLPEGFTLKWYFELFSDNRFWLAVGRTLFVSIVPIILNLAVMLITMFIVIVYLPKYERLLQMIVYLPYTIPSVVLSIVFLRVFSGTFGTSVSLLIIAFSVLIFPQMYQGIRNSMRTINIKQMVEAATMLSASQFQIFFRVIIPNLLPGIQVSILLSFSILIGEFALTQVLLGGYYETIQIMLYNYMNISSHIASAIVVAYFFIVLLTTIIALKVSKGILKDPLSR